MNYHSTRSAIFFLLVCIAWLPGCSYTVKPGNLPSAGANQEISFSGVTVLLVNAEKSAAETAVTADGRSSSGLKANRQTWSKKLVEAAAGELARRGAQVRANAKLVLSISLPDIIFKEDREASQFTVKAQVNSSTGWSKVYEGSAKAEGLSSPSETDRLAARALADAAKAMLNDAEFQAQLLKR
jgi:hypothetical protein